MNTPANWYDLSSPEIRQLIEDHVSASRVGGGDRSILKNIFSLIDLTSLDGTDNEDRIDLLCRKALSSADKGLPYPAAVCVYPPLVRFAKKYLAGSGISVAAVTGYFPSGQAPVFLKMEEVRYALGEGAEEIDFVISRGKFLEGELDYIYDEIASVSEIVADLPLKVIIETGELKTIGNVRKASEIAIAAGADFIKTSTGKSMPAATEEAAFVMTRVILDHYVKTGTKIGFKPSGGITESSVALRYYGLVKQVLGNDWLVKDHFRIGASRLADNIVTEIAPE